MGLREYTGCRTTLHRLLDSRIVRGWVRDFDGGRTTVSLKTSFSFHRGEQFYFQIHGKAEDALFYAQMMQIEDTDLSRNAVVSAVGASGAYMLNVQLIDVTFRLTTGVNHRPALEAARRSMDWITGFAETPLGRHQVRLLDIGESGVGMMIACELTRGDRVELHLDTPVGVAMVSGEVVYCRPDATMPTIFRAGIKIEKFDRLGSVRWQKLMQM